MLQEAVSEQTLEVAAAGVMERMTRKKKVGFVFDGSPRNAPIPHVSNGAGTDAASGLMSPPGLDAVRAL